MCESNSRLRGEVGSHRRCDPGEGAQVYQLTLPSRREPLTPTLICARLGVLSGSRIVFFGAAVAHGGDDGFGGRPCEEFATTRVPGWLRR